jgi:hypothetical protein
VSVSDVLCNSQKKCMLYSIIPFSFSSSMQQRACGDFVNLEDLSAQSSKILLEVGFACVFIGVCVRCECLRCIV